MQCVIFKEEPRCLKIVRKTSFEFLLLGWRWLHNTWYCLELFQKITNNLCILRECIHSGKIYIGAFIMGQYPILQNGRTEGFKVDWYPFKLGSCCMLPGDIPLCIRQVSCMRKSTQVISVFRSSKRTVLSSFRCRFLYLHHKKFEHFFKEKQLFLLSSHRKGSSQSSQHPKCTF